MYMLARKGVVMITFTAQTANTAPPAANQNMADSVGKKLNDFAAGLAHDVFEPGSKFSQRVLPEVVAGLRGSTVKILAEKVETFEQFNVCMKLGFDLFQGYFFQRPTVRDVADVVHIAD